MTAAWTLSIVAITSCRFVKVDGAMEGEEFGSMGLYWFESRFEGCFFINVQDFSLASNAPYWAGRKMNIARITSALSTFFASWILGTMWLGICCGCLHGKVTRIIIGTVIILNAALFCGIFTIFGSQSCRSGCSFHNGSICAVFAVIGYLIAAIILFSAPSGEFGKKKENASPSAAATGAASAAAPTVVIEKTVRDDGTIVTKTTTTNPDGSKTIEESVESPPELPPPVAVPAHAVVIGDEKV